MTTLWNWMTGESPESTNEGLAVDLQNMTKTLPTSFLTNYMPAVDVREMRNGKYEKEGWPGGVHIALRKYDGFRMTWLGTGQHIYSRASSIDTAKKSIPPEWINNMPRYALECELILAAGAPLRNRESVSQSYSKKNAKKWKHQHLVVFDVPWMVGVPFHQRREWLENEAKGWPEWLELAESYGEVNDRAKAEQLCTMVTAKGFDENYGEGIMFFVKDGIYQRKNEVPSGQKSKSYNVKKFKPYIDNEYVVTHITGSAGSSRVWCWDAELEIEFPATVGKWELKKDRNYHLPKIGTVVTVVHMGLRQKSGTLTAEWAKILRYPYAGRHEEWDGMIAKWKAWKETSTGSGKKKLKKKKKKSMKKSKKKSSGTKTSNTKSDSSGSDSSLSGGSSDDDEFKMSKGEVDALVDKYLGDSDDDESIGSGGSLSHHSSDDDESSEDDVPATPVKEGDAVKILYSSGTKHSGEKGTVHKISGKGSVQVKLSDGTVYGKWLKPIHLKFGTSASDNASNNTERTIGALLDKLSGTQCLLILVGASGSGKSSLCKKIGNGFASCAHLHQDCPHTLKSKAKKTEKAVEKAVKKGLNVVVDRTNLTVELRHKLTKDLPKSCDVIALVVGHGLDAAELKRRIGSRINHPKNPPPFVVDTQLQQLEKPTTDETIDIVVDMNLVGSDWLCSVLNEKYPHAAQKEPCEHCQINLRDNGIVHDEVTWERSGGSDKKKPKKTTASLVYDEDGIKIWVASCKQRKTVSARGLCVRGKSLNGKKSNNGYHDLVVVDGDAHILIDDGEEIPLPTLCLCVSTMNKMLTEEDELVVYCTAGGNRSPAVVATWLMARKGWDFEKAKEYLKKKRPIKINRDTQKMLTATDHDAISGAVGEATLKRQLDGDCNHWGGRNAAVAWNGQKLDMWRSALQKSIREGNVDIAKEAIRNWFFPIASHLDNKGNKGTLTNMFGRLSAIAVEDCKCTYAPMLVVATEESVRAIIEGSEHRSELTREETYECCKHMFALVTVLAQTPKLRILSWLKSLCQLPPLYVKPISASTKATSENYCRLQNQLRRQKQLPIRKQVASQQVKSALATLQEIEPLNVETKEAHDVRDFESMDAVSALVEAFDIIGDAVLEAGETYNDGYGKLPLRKDESKHRTNPRSKFFDTVRKVTPNEGIPALNALEKLCDSRGHQERPLYLYEAMLNLMQGTLFYTLDGATALLQFDLSDIEFNTLLEGTPSAAPRVPERYNDVHTSVGRSSGRNAADFANTTALVNNELPSHPCLSACYRATKTFIQDGATSRTNFNSVAFSKQVDDDEHRIETQESEDGIQELASLGLEAFDFDGKAPMSLAAFRDLDDTSDIEKEVEAIIDAVDEHIETGTQKKCYVLAQRTTSKSKVPTILTTRWVLKGPMSSRAMKNVHKNQEYLVRPTWYPETAVHWRVISFTYDDGTIQSYFYSPNVDSTGGLPTHVRLEKILQGTEYWLNVSSNSFKGRTSSISVNSPAATVKSVLKAIKGGILNVNPIENWLGVLTHLCNRYVLGIGDTDLANIFRSGIGYDCEEKNQSKMPSNPTVVQCLLYKHKKPNDETKMIDAIILQHKQELHSRVVAMDLNGLEDEAVKRHGTLVKLLRAKASGGSESNSSNKKKPKKSSNKKPKQSEVSKIKWISYDKDGEEIDVDEATKASILYSTWKLLVDNANVLGYGQDELKFVNQDGMWTVLVEPLPKKTSTRSKTLARQDTTGVQYDENKQEANRKEFMESFAQQVPEAVTHVFTITKSGTKHKPKMKKLFGEVDRADAVNVTAACCYSKNGLYNVVVPEKYQRKGRATKVVIELLQHVTTKKALKYKVTNIDNGAHQLYERLQRKMGLALELEGVIMPIATSNTTEENKETKRTGPSGTPVQSEAESDDDIATNGTGDSASTFTEMGPTGTVVVSEAESDGDSPLRAAMERLSVGETVHVGRQLFESPNRKWKTVKFQGVIRSITEGAICVTSTIRQDGRLKTQITKYSPKEAPRVIATVDANEGLLRVSSPTTGQSLSNTSGSSNDYGIDFDSFSISSANTEDLIADAADDHLFSDASHPSTSQPGTASPSSTPPRTGTNTGRSTSELKREYNQTCDSLSTEQQNAFNRWYESTLNTVVEEPRYEIVLKDLWNKWKETHNKKLIKKKQLIVAMASKGHPLEKPRRRGSGKKPTIFYDIVFSS